MEVGLTRPHHMIAGSPELLGEGVGRVDDLGAHVLRAVLQRVLSRDHAAARRGADPGVGEGAGEQGAFTGEPIHVRRDRILAAVGTRIGPHVFTHDQDDVRADVGGPRQGGNQKQSQGGEAAGHQGGTTSDANGCGVSGYGKKKGRFLASFLRGVPLVWGRTVSR